MEACEPEEDEAIVTCTGWSPNHPDLSHPLRTPGGNPGMIKGATCGFTNQLSHSRNLESRT